MRFTRVKAHVKNDGTVVRDHPRKLSGDPKVSQSKPRFDLEYLGAANNDSVPPVQPAFERVEKGYSEFIDQLRALDVDPGVYRPATLLLFAAGWFGALFSGLAGFPLVAACAGGASAFVLLKPIVSGFLRRRAARKILKKLWVENSPSEDYFAYAKKTVEDYPLEKPNPKVEVFSVSTFLPFGTRFKVKSKVDVDGLATIKWKKKQETDNEILSDFWFKASGVIYLHPKVDLSNERIESAILAAGVNLREAQMSKTAFLGPVDWDGADLRGADLRGATFYGPRTSMVGADLRGAKLNGVSLGGIDIRGCNLEGVDLTNVLLPKDIERVRFTPEQYEKFIRPNLDNHTNYHVVSFEKVIEEVGMTEKQFEFLVFSDVIQVRNVWGEKVTQDFNPDEHFVPAGEIHRAKKAMANTVSPPANSVGDGGA